MTNEELIQKLKDVVSIYEDAAGQILKLRTSLEKSRVQYNQLFHQKLRSDSQVEFLKQTLQSVIVEESNNQRPGGGRSRTEIIARLALESKKL